MSFVASIVFLAVLTFLGVGGELLAVVQLFRHGQRTPGSCYTNDPYKSISNWGGLSGGQLTNEGKRQHYQLGQFTRKRYSSFIPTKYNRSFIYAETTDVDRTHMSAQSNLYGLFPAKTTDQVWQKKVDWQAIPVHPADSDVWSSAFYKTSCAVYNTLLSEVLNSDEYEAIDSNYSAVYEYLSTYTGDNITTFSEANNIWDALKIEYLVGFSLPSWTKSVFPEPLRTLAGLVFELPTHTTQMKRITIGPFFNELVEYLEEMAEDNTSSQRFRIYSGHDTNIASVLNAFGAFSPPFPPEFASSIYIELHYESWRNVVRTYLKNGDNFTQLSVNGCNMDCTLENFRTVLSDYIVDVDTLEAECEETATATTVTNTDTRAVASPKRFSEEEVINLFKNWDS